MKVTYYFVLSILLYCLLTFSFANVTSSDPTDGFGPFEWPWEKFFDMLETMMDDMTQVILSAMQQTDDIITQSMDDVSNTILQLSDDILLMADKIGDMSVQIGIMADRIVQTEVLLADFILILTNHENSTIPIPPVGNYSFTNINTDIEEFSSSIPIVLFEPHDGEIYSSENIPDFKFNHQLNDNIGFLLYTSNNPFMRENESYSSLVTSTNNLQNTWERISSLYDNEDVYIAVRLVNLLNGTISGLSNSVQIHIS